MSPGFAKARTAFHEHASKALDSAADDILVSPIEEAAVVQLDQKVGNAWAFQASKKSDPPTQVRGWAVADGTVITPEQNLGILFAEAGVWSASPVLGPNELAELIVWAMGMNHRVVIDLMMGHPAPEMHVGADGAGNLTFVVGKREAGPGGAGGGPEMMGSCTVTLTADHKASLAIAWQ